MEQISFDSGIREYRINGKGILRFNPSDPNLYRRFLDALEQIREVEKEVESATAEDGTQMIRLMADTDRQVKEILSRVFGGDNDFGQILDGINLLAVGDNGERVITNLFSALLPVLQAGAEACVREQTAKAKAEAEDRRARR